MKGIKQIPFSEVIGPDKRPANETYLWEGIVEFDERWNVPRSEL